MSQSEISITNFESNECNEVPIENTMSPIKKFEDGGAVKQAQITDESESNDASSIKEHNGEPRCSNELEGANGRQNRNLFSAGESDETGDYALSDALEISSNQTRRRLEDTLSVLANFTTNSLEEISQSSIRNGVDSSNAQSDAVITSDDVVEDAAADGAPGTPNDNETNMEVDEDEDGSDREWSSIDTSDEDEDEDEDGDERGDGDYDDDDDEYSTNSEEDYFNDSIEDLLHNFEINDSILEAIGNQMVESKTFKFKFQNHTNSADGATDECPVCLVSFVADEEVRRLPCLHLFHTGCVDPWLKKHKKVCPKCRMSINTASDFLNESAVL